MPGLHTTASTSDLKQAEQRMDQELRRRAAQQLSGVQNPQDAHVRDVLPEEDLAQDDSNNVNGWNGSNRQWIQSGLTGDQLEQVYEVDSSNRMEDKLLGIFALSSVANDIITTEVVFEDGTGSRFERLMFEENHTLSEGEYALLRNPIIFNEGKDGLIFQWPRVDGDAAMVYHGLVAEKPGTTLGVRAQTENSAQGQARQPQ